MLDNITHAITDHVAKDAFGPREIGFAIPERYNASEILFRNLEAGRNEKVAVYSLQGNTTYGELCVKAARTGNALKSLGQAKSRSPSSSARIGFDIKFGPLMLHLAVQRGNKKSGPRVTAGVRIFADVGSRSRAAADRLGSAIGNG